jgi:predicted dehydrogenase
VTLTDIDPQALERARTSIYPGRYGAWDNAIALADSRRTVAEPADVVFIGTPPDTHVELALATLDAVSPRVLLIEKPLCGPDLAGCEELRALAGRKGVIVAVGYNHTVGKNTRKVEDLIRNGVLGAVSTLSARTREHWAGIFKAHPWLSGPAQSYLGFLARGGGALGEHSHAINIWQHFAHAAGGGRVNEVSAVLDMVEDDGLAYDRACFLTLRTERGLLGDVVQDVLTMPAEKSARLQGDRGFIEWRVNHREGADAVVYGQNGGAPVEDIIPKTRPDDFKAEIDHLAALMGGTVEDSPLGLERGLDTMMVIAAACKSHREKRRVAIDWRKGYRAEALM